MNITFVTGSMGDGAGGLASAVRGWVEALADSNHSITLFCLRLTQTFGPNRMPVHPRIRTIEVPCMIEPRTRFMLAPTLAKTLRRHCRENDVDIIHANGIWLPGTRISARIAEQFDIPFLVSPHGHLQKWAMENKRWKKMLAWFLYGRRSLGHASVIQAASDFESRDVRAMGVKAPIAVIPNIVDPSGVIVRGMSTGQAAVRNALFLSRIHPSKGLLDLVFAWAEVRPAGWQLTVAGGDEGGHLLDVKAIVKEFGLSDEITFVGAVPYDSRWDWFSRADLFILPTYSENFGISVAEALSASVPVITTRAAPWEVLEEKECGWWIDTGVMPLVAALSSATNTSDDIRRRMGERGRQLVSERYSRSSVATSLTEVYRWVKAGGEHPSCINRLM